MITLVFATVKRSIKGGERIACVALPQPIIGDGALSRRCLRLR